MEDRPGVAAQYTLPALSVQRKMCAKSSGRPAHYLSTGCLSTPRYGLRKSGTPADYGRRINKGGKRPVKPGNVNRQAQVQGLAGR